jgi:hypothetical protein
MDYEGRVQKVNLILAQRLGADPNDSDRFGNGEFAFGMDYGPEGQRGAMIWQIVRLDSPERPSTRLTLSGAPTRQSKWPIFLSAPTRS